MTRARPTLAERPALLVTGVVLIGLVVILLVPGHREFELEDPAHFVAAARALIEEHCPDRGRCGLQVHQDDVPAVLQVPGLRRVLVFGDRVELVTYRDPDINSGYAVWAADVPRVHEYHTATRYPDVYRFVYNDDEGRYRP